MMKLELRGPQAVQRIKNEKRKKKEQEKKEICKNNIMEYGLLYMCHCGNFYSIHTSHP